MEVALIELGSNRFSWNRRVFLASPPSIPFPDVFQDTGKSVFDPHLGKSCIDLNRAGTALLEIVSEPDLRCVCNYRRFFPN